MHGGDTGRGVRRRVSVAQRRRSRTSQHKRIAACAQEIVKPGAPTRPRKEVVEETRRGLLLCRVCRSGKGEQRPGARDEGAVLKLRPEEREAREEKRDEMTRRGYSQYVHGRQGGEEPRTKDDERGQG